MARRLSRIAARLFATRGYDATSVREIVEEAGVTKPTLYHYFGNKEGVAKALLTEPMTEFIRACEEILGIAEPSPEEPAAEEHASKDSSRTQVSQQPSDKPEGSTAGCPVDDLVRFLELNYEFCLEDPDRGRFLYALLFGPSGAHLSQELVHYSHRLLELIMIAAGRVSQACEMDESLAEDFVRAIRGLLVITTMDCLYQDAPLEEGSVKRQIQNLLNGFRGRADQDWTKVSHTHTHRREDQQSHV